MRLPYFTPPPRGESTGDPATDQTIAAIAARRHPRPLQALDLALLHSPPYAAGWNAFIGAIRTEMLLTPDIREIVICAVAAVNGALYEWDHHAPLASAAGVSDEALAGIKAGNGVGLSPKQHAAWAYAVEMTRDVTVSDETFARLREHCKDEREIVEITGTCAGYNAVSRFLVALDVGEKNGAKGE
ncbi:hypothetical protein PUNSTDRAFT_112972 [Punctularia strigosozonata HHB-11173 SS5]|uniref:uncharacterized protein n=1 Tax=Punctularia strigosozonata (strain HHB-11173) TaxID=741275 RepID=UPI0004416A1E|nr:uncharacterized protein PUNSTDRAFT_112972 [Punctularia strigosozonata HHB-11173 SS5]EIN09520.1 hypothetical protein PUNSTDRAFT_112972 [Punctularia strigosozonata HHB-11173 SS5]